MYQVPERKCALCIGERARKPPELKWIAQGGRATGDEGRRN